jgi:hypothetical protein
MVVPPGIFELASDLCEPGRLAELMLDLAEYCHAHGSSGHRITSLRPRDGGRGVA